MLQPVEVLPRRTLRRGVSLEVDVIAQRWDRARPYRLLDLSPDGLRLEGGDLCIGEQVIVCFTPPECGLGELTHWARVVRSAPPRGDEPATLGLELLDVTAAARAELERALSGRPPPLPRSRKKRELVWVDALVDLDLDPDELRIEPTPLAPLLTGGQSVASSCR